MLPQDNRFRVAMPAELAAALHKAGYPVIERGDQIDTSTALCHGGDSDAKLGLRYTRAAARWDAHCFTGDCSGDGALHNVQATAGVQLCRCDDCFQAWKDGRRLTGIARAAPVKANPPRKRKEPDTAELAARLWAAALPSTQGPDERHPAGRWLRLHGIWPEGEPLPASIRWLGKDGLRIAHSRNVRADSPAVGAVVLAMQRLDSLESDPRKVQLVTITADGGKAQHWRDGDKRTYGIDGQAVGLLSHWHIDDPHTFDLHVCEGVKDGMAILAGLPFEAAAGSKQAAWRWARLDSIAVAVVAGKSYAGIDPGLFASVTLWPDGEQEAQENARQVAQRWADTGYQNIEIELLPDGCDPADLAKRGKE